MPCFGSSVFPQNSDRARHRLKSEKEVRSLFVVVAELHLTTHSWSLGEEESFRARTQSPVQLW